MFVYTFLLSLFRPVRSLHRIANEVRRTVWGVVGGTGRLAWSRISRGRRDSDGDVKASHDPHSSKRRLLLAVCPRCIRAAAGVGGPAVSPRCAHSAACLSGHPPHKQRRTCAAKTMTDSPLSISDLRATWYNSAAPGTGVRVERICQHGAS